MQKSSYGYIGTVAALVIGIWGVWFKLEFGSSLMESGQFGDKFGGLNTLFTGLALVGLITTLFYQYHQAKQAGDEMKIALETLGKTTAALERQAELTSKQIKQERDLSWNDKVEQERSLVLALRCEMQVAWHLYSINIAPAIEELDGTKPLRLKYPEPPDYFPIYKANGIMIGRLNDNLLRTDIVTAYTVAVALLSMLQFNNERAWDDDPRYLSSRVEYADQIRAMHDHLKRTHQSLNKSFEMWLKK